MWHNEYSKEEIIKNQKNKYLIIFIIIVLLLLITITILSIYLYKKNQQLKIIKSQIDINNKNLTEKIIYYLITCISKNKLNEQEIINIGIELMMGPSCKMTKTELSTLWLLTFGYNNQQIAKALNICTNYVYQIKSSLNHKGINEIEAAKQTCIELIIEKGKL